MEYLRAVIQSDTRGTLYKKDFKIQKVFNTFVHLHVNRLINTGEIYEGEYYKALIIPGYGPYRRDKQKKNRDIKPETSKDTGKKDVWITLKVPEPPSPERPMDFFTLELHLTDRRSVVLSENFLLREIDYFWASIERALEQIKVLDYQEKRQRYLYACNDDLFDFDREELPTWLEEGNELIEIVDSDELTTDGAFAFPHKALNDMVILETKRMLWGRLVEDAPKYASQVVEPPPTGMQIFITRTALESIQEMARSYVQVEIGGMLIGHVYQDSVSHDYLVEITDHIPAQNTLASEVELRITFETWQEQSTVLRERYPGKRIVGWYHTHLNLVTQTFYTEINETRHVLYSSPIFFSQDDHFTHRQFFREKWYLAMVLDSDGNLIFYQWEGSEIVAAHTFYIAEQEKETKAP